MNIKLNNKETVISEKTTVKELLANNNIKNHNGIAIAINNIVISKKNWDNHFLKNGDKVVVIEAISGG